jgi:transcriptional regulator with XRE-family HTH domain
MATKYSVRSFPDRLRKRRMELDWTQEFLGKRAKLGSGRAARIVVSHFECGTRVPTLRNLVKLAEALDTSIDYLAGKRE